MMASGRQLISDSVRALPFVKALLESLGDSVVHTPGALRPGQLGVDTVGAQGFSLRTYSRRSTNKRSVSILNLTAGRERVYFSSSRRLKQYLPEKSAAIDRLTELVGSLGGDMEGALLSDRTSIDSEAAVQNVEAFAEIALELAAPASAAHSVMQHTQPATRAAVHPSDFPDAMSGAVRQLEDTRLAVLAELAQAEALVDQLRGRVTALDRAISLLEE